MSTGLENECKLSYNNGFRCPLGTGVAGREKKLVIDSKEIALQTPSLMTKMDHKLTVR